jgi:hypothetical protein
VIAAILVATTLAAFLNVGAASAFASPAFQQQWNSVESAIPNFWGPLSTARDGQLEPYVEGVAAQPCPPASGSACAQVTQPGQRLVQYFDKARMELTTPSSPVTNGLLTVELKTGQLQTGDNSFESRSAATIGIAGDPGSPGPTYASLAQVPEKSEQFNGPVALAYDAPSNAFHNVLPASDPGLVASTWLTDPGGRFGQNVPKVFADFLNRIPGGYLSAMGYPISPAFMATVQVGGVPNVSVVIQAFQRKVLTYTATNPQGFQVEFGNIGQHYYQWRYGGNAGPTPTTGPTTVPTTPTTTSTATTAAISVPEFTNIDDTSVTVVYRTTFPACGTAEYQAEGDSSWTTDINTFSCASADATTTQSIDLSGLTPGTKYTVRPAVKDVSQTISYGPVGTFTTAPATPVSVSPLGVSHLTGTSVTISFTTSVPTCAIVQYRVHGTQKWGADTDISSLNCKSAEASMTHNKDLTGMTPGSRIDVRAAVKNPADQAIHVSQIVTFETAS